MSGRRRGSGWGSAVVPVVLTAVATGVLALGVGWVVAAAFGEPPAERWDRAGVLAVSSATWVVVGPVFQRWRSRREVSRGRIACALRVVDGTVPGLRTRWTFGRAVFTEQSVDFRRWRFAGRRRPGDDVSFTVSGCSDPRDSTLRESLRVGTDARVVDLRARGGACVRLAATLPASLASALRALDV